MYQSELRNYVIYFANGPKPLDFPGAWGLCQVVIVWGARGLAGKCDVCLLLGVVAYSRRFCRRRRALTRMVGAARCWRNVLSSAAWPAVSPEIVPRFPRRGAGTRGSISSKTPSPEIGAQFGPRVGGIEPATLRLQACVPPTRPNSGGQRGHAPSFATWPSPPAPARPNPNSNETFGVWILDFGFWIFDFGLWILDLGFWIFWLLDQFSLHSFCGRPKRLRLDFGVWILDFGFGLGSIDTVWILHKIYFHVTPSRVGGFVYRIAGVGNFCQKAPGTHSAPSYTQLHFLHFASFLRWWGGSPSWLHLVGSGGLGVWGRDMGDAHKTYDVRWWSSMMMMMTTTVPLPLLILFIIIRVIFKTINISIVGILPTCHLACYWHVCHCLLVLEFVFDAAAEVMLGHASLISLCSLQLCSLQHTFHFIRRCIEVYWIANMLKRNGMCMDTSHPTLFPLQMNYCIRPIHTQSAPVHRWILTKSPLSNFTYWMQLDGKREQIWYCILFIACLLSLMIWTDSTVFDVYAGLMHGKTALSQEQLQRRGDTSHTSHCVCQNMSHCRSVFNSWHNACLWCFKHFTFCE